MAVKPLNNNQEFLVDLGVWEKLPWSAWILFDIYTYNRRHKEWEKEESERLDKEADKNE